MADALEKWKHPGFLYAAWTQIGLGCFGLFLGIHNTTGPSGPTLFIGGCVLLVTGLITIVAGQR